MWKKNESEEWKMHWFKGPDFKVWVNNFSLTSSKQIIYNDVLIDH